MATPVNCRCCNQCVPCACNPPRCLDMVVFGGSCPACLPLGTRIPLTEIAICTACHYSWAKSCGTAPNLDCTDSLPGHRYPFCCPENPLFPFPRPCPDDFECQLAVQGYAAVCDPDIRLFCGFTGVPPQNSYGLRVQWRCDLGKPGGLIQAVSAAVQCDPFQITFTNFVQTLGVVGLGPTPCSGLPCSSPPSSVIIIPHA